MASGEYGHGGRAGRGILAGSSRPDKKLYSQAPCAPCSEDADLALTLAFAAACSSPPPQGTARPRRRGSSEPRRTRTRTPILAEIALERGDCSAASENYCAAAAKGGRRAASARRSRLRRASTCPPRWEAVQRWRALAPDDHEAAALYATVALKLYRIPEARSASRQRTCSWRARSRREDRELTAQLLDGADATSVLAADRRRARRTRVRPRLILYPDGGAGPRRLRREARGQYARLALKRDPNFLRCEASDPARTFVMRGDAAAPSRRPARRWTAARSAAPSKLVDTLVALDHMEEARHGAGAVAHGGNRARRSRRVVSRCSRLRTEISTRPNAASPSW